MKNHAGVIDELVNGEWVEPGTGKRYSITPEDIVIADSLDGAEADLISKQHAGKSLVVVSDAFTHEALGKRVYQALHAAGLDVTEFIWPTPSCSEEGVKQVQQGTRGREVMIAVGSGTINDTVKYACFLDNREYSVFATSPMNAFTTNTASVSFNGFKKSIPCRGAKGIYFDLSILARCPRRLISAAFADVICRTTAQVDWLMSHILFDTAYTDTPYKLLAYDEADMIDNASAILNGEADALAMLTRISAIMGLGTCFTDTTHSGSMAEHMISHYIDMFAGEAHPGTSHGEQVGVATITMSRLQNQILLSEAAPVMRETEIPIEDLKERFGRVMADSMIEQTGIKALDAKLTDQLNARFASDWDKIRAELKAVMLPFERLHDSMRAAGCQTSSSEMKIQRDIYRDAILYARFIRDRFTMLDIAGDSGQLNAYAEAYA